MGPELCSSLHLLYPAVQYIICGEFRCDISSCVINLSFDASFFRQPDVTRQPGRGDGRVRAALRMTAGCHSAEVTSSALDSHRGSERWIEKYGIYSLWKLCVLPGWLRQTLFSSFVSIFFSGFQKLYLHCGQCI